MERKRASFYADLDVLRRHFNEVDAANTGLIGHEELTTMVKNMQGIEDSTTELLEKLDRDKDGKISFEDFEALFAIERETVKKVQASELQPPHFSVNAGDLDHDPHTVVLRSKKKRRPGPIQGHSTETHTPVGNKAAVKPSFENEETPDQLMKKLESPQLSRHSKVLSWISGSDDYFTDSDGKGEFSPSALVSPIPSHDDKTHIKSILETVCQTKDVGKEAISKLCSHVKADAQEEKELLALLSRLDKTGQGHVSLDEFVKGLQAFSGAATVSSTPLLYPLFGFDKRESLPVFSESFDSTYNSSKKEAVKANTDEHLKLAVLDPDNSGYVSIEDVVDRWQMMGIEPSEGEIERILSESLSMDTSGQVSISDLTALLEGALTGEGKSHQGVLKLAAIKSFKNEISLLKSQMNQVSLERDAMKHSLNRTMEESKRLVQEGDESVDFVTKNSEIKIREQQDIHNKKLKELEKSYQEKSERIQETAHQQTNRLKEKLDATLLEEGKLKVELKIAREENEKTILQLQKANEMLAKQDSTLKALRAMGSETMTDSNLQNQLIHVSELENELSEQTAHNHELQEQIRELKDKNDVLNADIEELKQKYISQKRRMQRRRSGQSTSQRHHRRRHSSEKMKHANNTAEKPAVSPTTADDIDFHEVDVQYGSSETISSSGDDLMAQSSASLHDELAYEDRKSDIARKIMRLKGQKADLEASCRELEARAVGDEMKASLSEELKVKRQRQAEIDLYIQKLEKQRRCLNAAKLEIEAQLATAEETMSEQLENFQDLRNELGTNNNGDLVLISGQRAEELELEVNQLKQEILEYQQKIAQQEIVLEELRNSHQPTFDATDQVDHSELRATVTRQYEENERAEGKITDLQSQLVSAHNDISELEEELESSKSLLHDQRSLSAQYDGKILELERGIAAIKANTAENELRWKKTEENYCSEISLLKAQLKQTEENYSSEIALLRTQQVSTFDCASQCQLEQEYTLQARNVVLQMVKVLNNQIKALQCQFATVFENHTRRLQTATGKLGRILTEETSMKINMPRMKSETATHDIMMQMKSHLEKLKNVLESKSKTSGKVTSSELGIMNELIEKHKKWEQENTQRKQAMKQKISEATAMICEELKTLHSNAEMYTKRMECAISEVKEIQSVFRNHKEEAEEQLRKNESQIKCLKTELLEEQAKLRQQMEQSNHDLDQMQSERANLQQQIKKLLTRESEKSKNSEKEEKIRQIRQLQAVKEADKTDQEKDQLAFQLAHLQKQKESREIQLTKAVQAKESEVQRLKDEVECLRAKVDNVVHEPAEAIILSPLLESSVNETILLETQKHLEYSKESLARMEEDYQSQIMSMKQKYQLENAQHEDELRGLRSELNNMQLQMHKEDELTVARDAIAMATQDLSNLYSLVSGKRVPYFPDLNSAMLAVSEEVRQLIDQVQRHEHEDLQFNVEHEEEVRALAQQIEQLKLRLRELQQQQDALGSQEGQVSDVLLHDLINNKAQLELRLWDKTVECDRRTQRAAELASEKKVLLNIIKQLTANLQTDLSSFCL